MASGWSNRLHMRRFIEGYGMLVEKHHCCIGDSGKRFRRCISIVSKRVKKKWGVGRIGSGLKKITATGLVVDGAQAEEFAKTCARGPGGGAKSVL